MALLNSLGYYVVKQRAGAGDREAQFSQGHGLMAAAVVDHAELLRDAGSLPHALVGLAP
jgi:hypothetical protein